MSKSAKKRSIAKSTPRDGAPVVSHQAAGPANNVNQGKFSSKQSRVLGMLHSPAGATIAAIMKATGWQRHSVRGFLAGVVRKRLRLKLVSKKVDDERVYQVVTGVTAATAAPSAHSSKRRAG